MVRHPAPTAVEGIHGNLEALWRGGVRWKGQEGSWDRARSVETKTTFCSDAAHQVQNLMCRTVGQASFANQEMLPASVLLFRNSAATTSASPISTEDALNGKQDSKQTISIAAFDKSPAKLQLPLDGVRGSANAEERLDIDSRIMSRRRIEPAFHGGLTTFT